MHIHQLARFLTVILVPVLSLFPDRIGAESVRLAVQSASRLGHAPPQADHHTNFGPLTAVPSKSDQNSIILKWGNALKSSGIINIERWTEGEKPAIISRVTDGSDFLDRTPESNRIYYYRVIREGEQSNTVAAVISDLQRPFHCPTFSAIPSNLLGVDRTESFKNPGGETVSITIRAPESRPIAVVVPPCDTNPSCSDYDNVKNALASVTQAGGGMVQLNAGDYHFHPPHNVPNVFIQNAADVIFAGAEGNDGAPLTHLYFNFDSSLKPVLGLGIAGGHRVLVKNITIDWDPLLVIPGVIQDYGASEQRFIVQDPDYFVPDSSNPPKLVIFAGYDFKNRTYLHQPASRGEVKAVFNPNFNQDGQYFYTMEGQYFPNNLTAIGIVKSGDGVRVSQGAHDVAFEGVHILGGGGTGFVLAYDTRGVRLSKSKVVRKPDSLLKLREKPRFISLWGDSDARENRGELLIENSEFELVEDDGFNIVGRESAISSVNSASEVELISNAPSSLFPHPLHEADLITLIDPVTLIPISETDSTVTDLHKEEFEDALGRHKIKFTVKFDPPMEALMNYRTSSAKQQPVFAEPKNSSQGAIVRNSCFHDLVGRLVVQTGNVLVENNVFANTSYSGIELSAFPEIWHEGPGATNVIIRNNNIIGAGYIYDDRDKRGRFTGRLTGLLGAAIKVSSLSNAGLIPRGWPHHSIEITGNFISNTPGLGIMISGAHDIIVADNTIVDANAVPFDKGYNSKYCGAISQGFGSMIAFLPKCIAKTAAQGAIMVTQADDVRLSNNIFLGGSTGVFVDPSSTRNVTITGQK